MLRPAFVARAVARRAYLLVLGVVLIGGVAYLSSSRSPTLYQASAHVSVEPRAFTTDPNVDLGNLAYAVSLATTYANTPLTSDTLARASTFVPERSPDQIRTQVHLATVAGEPEIEVIATDSFAETAEGLANGVALSLVTHFIDQAALAVQTNPKVLQAQATVDATTAAIAATRSAIVAAQQRGAPSTDLQVKLAQQQLQLGQQTANLSIAEQAALQGQPIFWVSSAAKGAVLVAPDTIISTSLGVAAGLLVAVGLAVLLETVRTTIRSARDVNRWAALATLGVVPSAADMHDAAFAPVTPEQHALVGGPFRHLMIELALLDATHAQQTLLVMPADERTADEWSHGNLSGWIATHLAIAAALAGQRTLFVDAEWEAPTAETTFGLPAQDGGLFTSLAGIGEPFALNDPAAQATSIPNLDVLPVGATPPNHDDLLSTAFLDRLFRTVRQEYQRIIVLAPKESLALSPRVSGLMEQVDGVLLVARAGVTSGTHMHRVVTRLRRANAYLSGAVLVSETLPPPGQVAPVTRPQQSMPPAPVQRAPTAGRLQMPAAPTTTDVIDRASAHGTEASDETTAHLSSVMEGESPEFQPRHT